MTDKLEELKLACEKLPKELKQNALNLVTRMGEVIEGIGDEPIAWRPESLRLVQPTSDRQKLPKGAGIGSIIIGEKLMDSPIKLIPIRAWTSRTMWSPDQNEARMLCSSPDGLFGYIGKFCKECEYARFNEETNRSACNKGLTVMCISADLTSVFIINFTKTNYKNGLDWKGLMSKAGVAPFKRVYELKSKTNEKYKQVESLTVETKNESTAPELIPFLEILFKKVSDDRNDHILKFYEMVKNKQQSENLLEDNSEEVQVLPAPETATTEEQNSMTKKYVL